LPNITESKNGLHVSDDLCRTLGVRSCPDKEPLS